MIKIGIYDNHPALRDAMVTLLPTLDDEFAAVTLDPTAPQAALAAVKSEGVNIVLSPVYSGASDVALSFFADVAQRYDRVRCIAILVAAESTVVTAAIRCGAKGILAPSADAHELHRAVLTVRGGYEYFSKEVTDLLVDKYVDGVVVDDAEKSSQEPDIDALSARQIEILRLWGDNMSNKDIADRLFLSVRTVESHKNHIMQKLNLKTTVDIIRFGIRNNIIKL